MSDNILLAQYEINVYERIHAILDKLDTNIHIKIDSCLRLLEFIHYADKQGWDEINWEQLHKDGRCCRNDYDVFPELRPYLSDACKRMEYKGCWKC